MQLGLVILSFLSGNLLGDAVVISFFEWDLASEGSALSDLAFLDWVGQEVSWCDDDSTLFVLEVLDDLSSVSHVLIWHLGSYLDLLGVRPVLLVASSSDGAHVGLSLDSVTRVLVWLVTSVIGWSTEETFVDSSLLDSCGQDVPWLDHD